MSDFYDENINPTSENDGSQNNDTVNHENNAAENTAPESDSYVNRDESVNQNACASETTDQDTSVNTSDGEQKVDGAYGFSYRNGGYKYNDDLSSGNYGSQSSQNSQNQNSWQGSWQSSRSGQGTWSDGQAGYTSSSQAGNDNTSNQQSYGGQQYGGSYGGQNSSAQNEQHYEYNWQKADAERRAHKADHSFLHRKTANGGSGTPKKPRRKMNVWAKTVAIAAVFGLVASLVFSGTTYLTNRAAGNSTAAKTVSSGSNAISNTTTSTATTVTDVSDIVENVMPAIVQVTNVSLEQYRSIFGQGQMYESTSAGSGIIVSQDDKYVYIASNNHVVTNSNELTVTYEDGKSVGAEIVGTDPSHDLAVIRVKISDMDSATLSSIKVATLGDSDKLKVGESAIVIGNALGYGQSVTTGVISATGREVSLQDDSGRTITNKLIQTDAAVNPGNSGGALLNMSGEVIGVVSAKYSDTSVEGMGYAIPITKARTIIESLIKTGSYSDEGEDGADDETADAGDDNSANPGIAAGSAYLGIYGMDITADTSNEYDIPSGVYISKVMNDSAADEAGLGKGDVITGIDGNKVTSMQEVKNYITSKKPGDEIKITYADHSDDYQSRTVTVKLGEAK